MEPYKRFFITFYYNKLNLNNIDGPVKNRASLSYKKKRGKVVAPICGKITLPKGYIKTQKVTNGPKFITQSKSSASEVIVVEKLQTDLYVNSGLTVETRASVTPVKHIPGKKRNIKSLATSPPRKDPIKNQDKNNLGIQKYQCLPPHVSPFPHGFKSLINKANNDNTKTTDTSCTDKDDTSRANRDNFIENVKYTKNTNDDD